MSERWHSAADIVKALGGRWGGQRTRCRCPVRPHSSDKTPLAVSQTHDGRVLVHCFAGCDQHAVIGELKKLGLWNDGELTTDPSYPGYITTRHDGGVRWKTERESRRAALDIWDGAKSARGTIVEEYLQARAIRLPVSTQLRFTPRLRHSPSRLSFRAMIARISDNRGFCGIQRTFFDANEPKKAGVFPNKMSKGPMGAGAVRLYMPSGETLGIAEGIETALSVKQLYSFSVWATLSAQRLGKIEIPDGIRQIIIFGDSGDVGTEQAFIAQEQYERRGYGVEVIFPAAHFKVGPKADFNDVLRAEVAS